MITSFNERTMILEGFSAPLKVASLDYEFCDDLDSVLDMFLVPESKIMHHKNWLKTKNTISESIERDIFKDWLLEYIKDGDREPTEQLIKQLTYPINSFFNKIRCFEDISEFCFRSAQNSVYLMSEGPLFDIYESEDRLLIPRVLRTFLKDIKDDEDYIVSRDELSYWIKTTQFLLEPVSNTFKKRFNIALEYDIPFGQSPATKKDTLENVLAQAKNASIIPIVQGASEIGTAISSHNWALAIESALTSGVTVIILVSAVSISEIIYKWHKS